jgi:hypothetical protein
MAKSLTKDCPDCPYLEKRDEGKLQFCTWGKSKKLKKLIANRVSRVVREQCTLLKNKFIDKKSNNFRDFTRFGYKKITDEEKEILKEVI